MKRWTANLAADEDGADTAFLTDALPASAALPCALSVCGAGRKTALHCGYLEQLFAQIARTTNIE